MVSHGNSSGGGGSRAGKSSRQGTASPGSQGMKKGPWTTAEDGILMEYVNKYGEGNWNAVQRNSGLQRCGKSCRLRWANHLRPNLKKGAFSPEEERLILELHAKLGNKWARMASQLPGRTDNEIKNYWNTRVKRLQRAGLPIYPDDIHRQIHGQHQQFISPSSPSPFSSLISGPRLSNSNFGINPSLPAFFSAPGNFQTVSPFHNSPLISHTKPQFTIFRDNDDPNNNNYNPNVMPLVSSSNLRYAHQNFHQKEDNHDRHPLPTNPFQFNLDDIDHHHHHHPNLFVGSRETELPSIQSPVGTTPVSSSSAGAGDHLMGTASSGDYQYYDDIVPHHEVANSGLLDALLEESKALLNKENSSSCGDYNKRKEICGSIDEIVDHHDPSPAQSSISLNEKDALEEINPIDDDLSSLLNNFPLTVPVPDWYDESVRNSNKQSSNLSDVSSGSTNNNGGQDSNVPPALNATPTSEEDDWSSLNPYCWNNMPGIC